MEPHQKQKHERALCSFRLCPVQAYLIHRKSVELLIAMITFERLDFKGTVHSKLKIYFTLIVFLVFFFGFFTHHYVSGVSGDIF